MMTIFLKVGFLKLRVRASCNQHLHQQIENCCIKTTGLIINGNLLGDILVGSVRLAGPPLNYTLFLYLDVWAVLFATLPKCTMFFGLFFT